VDSRRSLKNTPECPPEQRSPRRKERALPDNRGKNRAARFPFIAVPAGEQQGNPGTAGTRAEKARIFREFFREETISPGPLVAGGTFLFLENKQDAQPVWSELPYKGCVPGIFSLIIKGCISRAPPGICHTARQATAGAGENASLVISADSGRFVPGPVRTAGRWQKGKP
jgi:hypothetical protein